MTAHEAKKVQTTTVQQVKQQAAKTSKDLTIPAFWLTDWLLHVIDKPPLFLITDESYQLTDSEFEQFNAGVNKIQQGTPLAYLTCQQEFWSLDFKVNEHTLIPRPDTEVLVEQTLSWIKNNEAECQNKRLLDLGTGSGCIAISLAHELQQKHTDDNGNKKASWHVIAVDYSEEALQVARCNAVQNKVENIEFIQSSWYRDLSIETTPLFDVIVSNPPYIDESDEHLMRLQAEPMSALSAGNNGLADIEHIIKHAPQYLHSRGLLAIEHGYDQGFAVRQLLIASGFDNVQTIQDFGGNERVTLAQLKK